MRAHSYTRKRANVDAMRLALRMTEQQLAIFGAVKTEGKRKIDVAADLGVSKQRVHQVVTLGERILAEARDPSPELLAKLPRIEAEACSLAGLRSVGEVIAALTENRMPRWMKPVILIALCKRFDIAVPGKSASRVADSLMKLAAHNEQGRRLIDETARMLRDLRREENARLLEAVTRENTPNLEAAKRELAPTGS